MSCPHVSGIAALLKSVNRDWLPSTIKSAMMTTTYTLNNKKSPIGDVDSSNSAGPFTYGSGHVDPERAAGLELIVRDVFLSSDKRSQMSKFSFVRFKTMEEASKVAKTTNGILAVHRGSLQYGAKVLVVNDTRDKGKKIWVSKPRFKPISYSIQKGNLDLEKCNRSDKGNASSSEESTSVSVSRDQFGGLEAEDRILLSGGPSKPEKVIGVKDKVQNTRKKEESGSCNINKHKMKIKNSVVEEVAKTLKIGAAVRFDFNGIEDEMFKAISRREEKDEIRFEEMKR
ncbi:hypothetical protein Ddye_017722 [Dipteronia dyeriana]|uniref:Peptidase S8/S53 domain-containing protein n=1 Tax=Dipteronia dyeriana TaxID=168575 RepID=A0AAD9U9T0_9ROSI|nr:hypothetical protein Ddye_017722 [Dipteronia dyeriana]